ncbi:Ninjurin-1-like protein, partial [Dinothrombium tinctorium]
MEENDALMKNGKNNNAMNVTMVPSPKSRAKSKADDNEIRKNASKAIINDKCENNDESKEILLLDETEGGLKQPQDSDAKRKITNLSSQNKADSFTVENDNNRASHKLDFNVYATKKNIAQGLQDIALLTANATQLKYVVQRGATGEHYLHIANIALIGASIALQVLVGIILLLNTRQHTINGNNRAECCNSIILLIVFLITIVNVFIVVFVET